MRLNATVRDVTERITVRSTKTRRAYLEKIRRIQDRGPLRHTLSCGNMAHVAAACSGGDKRRLVDGASGNIGIVSAYNDMLSAHQPFESYPGMIKEAARSVGGTAQVAGGVPAMCDGVTQGQPGMELSLFSRDIIAMSAGVALSHNCFDAALFLGVCDKIVPGLVMAAASFGHLPAVFVPAGPMPSGIPNDEKARVRQKYAAGDLDRKELLRAEMSSYHSPGTCTFYGTANSNQMLMEIMGLHLPGTAFIPPGTALRDALTRASARHALKISALGENYTPVCEVLDVRAFVNAMVGLHATGGSTNLVIHLSAMAGAAGIVLDLQDFSDLSAVTPLLTRIYPNGLADVNHFHAAGGVGYVIAELIGGGLVHEDVKTVSGRGLSAYTEDPFLDENGALCWRPGTAESLDTGVLRPLSDAFQKTGGLVRLTGNIGDAVIKISAVHPSRHVIEAPVRIFHSQDAVKDAVQAGELDCDVIIVVRFQGPKANGMPELHGLTPSLGVIQERGYKVALLTDGRMSGASGKIPAAIHLSPEALDGGPIARLQEGDVVRLDGLAGTLNVLIEPDIFQSRPPAQADLSAYQDGLGRDMFQIFRRTVGPASAGAGVAIRNPSAGWAEL